MLRLERTVDRDFKKKIQKFKKSFHKSFCLHFQLFVYLSAKNVKIFSKLFWTFTVTTWTGICILAPKLDEWFAGSRWEDIAEYLTVKIVYKLMQNSYRETYGGS